MNTSKINIVQASLTLKALANVKNPKEALSEINDCLSDSFLKTIAENIQKKLVKKNDLKITPDSLKQEFGKNLENLRLLRKAYILNQTELHFKTLNNKALKFERRLKALEQISYLGSIHAIPSLLTALENNNKIKKTEETALINQKLINPSC